jgi:hypothetical protein
VGQVASVLEFLVWDVLDVLFYSLVLAVVLSSFSIYFGWSLPTGISNKKSLFRGIRSFIASYEKRKG